jgi:hypothetical protein
MLAPNNNRGVTYQTDEKHQKNMSEYVVGVVNVVFNRYQSFSMKLYLNVPFPCPYYSFEINRPH